MTIFIGGGTGYLGRALSAKLVARGHRVLVLARAGSERRVPAGVEVVQGNALEKGSFAQAVPQGATFVHLIGVAHPAPWKEGQFRAIDLVSLRASASAAVAAGVPHFVYVSVAQPAPVMRAYISVRSECEEYLKERGLLSTILRPWYVLGPGHRWPVVLKPFYALLEALPATRGGARRLGLVTLEEMARAMQWAVENPPTQTRIVEVPEIRAISSYSK